MPHKTQHHSHRHLTLQTTLVLIIASAGLNIYWGIYGINTPTIIAGLAATTIALFLFAIPTIKYNSEVTYQTDYESLEEAYKDLTSINDGFYKEKIRNNNSHFKELSENKIEAEKPFLNTKFNVDLEIEKENSTENKSIKYNIKIDQEHVMNGTVTFYKDNDKVYIQETEETVSRMPILGTMISESKTIKMFERTAKRKDYKITNVEFKPYIRTKQKE